MRDEVQQLSILERRKVVAERYLRGETQWRIALALEVSQPTISSDLAALRAEWRQKAAADVQERLDEQLAKLDELEKEAWQAWVRSCLPRRRKGIKRRSGDKPTDETSTSIERRDGNPRFLGIVEGCIDKRLDILGVKRRSLGPTVNLTQNNLTVSGADPAASLPEGEAKMRARRERLLSILGSAGVRMPDQFENLPAPEVDGGQNQGDPGTAD